MCRLIIVCALAALAMAANAQPVPQFTYRDTAAAQKDWQPQFGSKPVRVEKLADGSTCVVLEAEFKAAGDRVCWDWVAPLDLSQAGRAVFDLSATNGGLVQTLGVYFGTPNGWYSGFGGNVDEEWHPVAYHLSDFGTEGAPDGWGKVTRFRFSPWSSGPGKVAFRLRGLRLVKQDPAESYVRNGSFEIPGVGVPYAWGSGHWGVGDLPWVADMDLWRKHFRLDTTVAHEGKTSLLLDNTADLPRLHAAAAFVTLPTTHSSYTFSVWLRSDQEKLPVSLICGDRGADVVAGREWTQAVIRGVPPGQNLGLHISPQAAGKLWIDAVQLQAGDQATVEFHPYSEDEALAAREKRLDWSPPRRTADIAAGRRTTGPVHAASATIDAQGRFLLDGKPYIQHSFGLEFVSDLRVIDEVARLGFRDICVEVNPGVTTAKLTECFDRCAQVGLRVIPWLDGTIPRERFTDHITALKAHPALLAWYVMDEPSGDGFKEAEARYKLAKELDPTHPAFINYLADKLTGHKGDICSTDVYPIPHGLPVHAINAVAAMVKAAALEHKPVWMWLQGTGYAYWMDREPTPRELSCMVYGSLIAGARGIYYFAQFPRTKECLDEMRAMCVEVDALTPSLGSFEPAPAVTCNQLALRCKAFALGGKLWVLAVNTGAKPCEAKLSLPRASGQAEVIFEGRRVTAQAGSWRDSFGPYERHVYRLASPK